MDQQQGQQGQQGQETGAVRATTGELMPCAGRRGPDVGGGIAATDAIGYSPMEGEDTEQGGSKPVGDDEEGRDAGSGVQH
ncbi:hypothetical protein GPECTOR_7g1194 [Gonium pectorale]|uniref:Uncharacterized protein n=1 Tax=Gonium pectorale TaxID=33097 RepID=A0A150GVD2_GONPE|nr:hypothetical protein GPECTOR_7g1194 [Gonium pectorale]|eukprot:KXZ53300.1 hypothetical protein GPECTOR_7g1194 [Gonium pectorale]